MKSLEPNTTPVIAEFTGCEVGWIYFSVRADSQLVEVRASEVFDPFPDLIAWLESIAIGVQECAFEMEEEGPEKRFEYRRITYNSFRFRITDNYKKILLEAYVDPKQLVSAFYKGIKDFSSSEKFDRLEWEDELLWERFARVTNPPTERKVVLRHLISQTREKLIELFFKVAPYVVISFPDARDGDEAWARGIDSVAYPDDPEKQKGKMETPQYWPIPEDYDSWQMSKRKKFLEEELNVNVSSKNGTRLGNIYSEIIERYMENTTKDKS